MGVAPFLTNAGKAKIKGGELELTWAPTSEFLVESSVGYLDSELTEIDRSNQTIARLRIEAGQQSLGAPQHCDGRM